MERSPMRRDAGANAGFTTGEPWLPLGNEIAERSIAAHRGDPCSMLSLHRRRFDARRLLVALKSGGRRGPSKAPGRVVREQRLACPTVLGIRVSFPRSFR